MSKIAYRGREYAAVKENGQYHVSVQFRFHQRTASYSEREAARRWLGDHGLRRGKARRLLEATERA